MELGLKTEVIFVSLFLLGTKRQMEVGLKTEVDILDKMQDTSLLAPPAALESLPSVVYQTYCGGLRNPFRTT